jgi:hypothetical protein
MPNLLSDPCCLNHRDERRVRVRDRMISNYSEDYRRYCEAKMVSKMKPEAKAIWLSKVLEKRGEQAFQKLVNELGR